jgi:tRNA A22 N-methylase
LEKAKNRVSLKNQHQAIFIHEKAEIYFRSRFIGPSDVIILAGVGGHLIIKILSEIFAANSHYRNFFYILSPERDQWELREFLYVHKMNLKQSFVCLDKKFREVFFFTPDGVLPYQNGQDLLDPRINQDYLASLIENINKRRSKSKNEMIFKKLYNAGRIYL